MFLLHSINKKYLIYTFFIYLILFGGVSEEMVILLVFNLMVVFGYFTLIETQLNRNTAFYSAKRLAWTIFIYGLFSIFAYNFISYIYNNNYFVFSEMDALFYHYEAIELNSKPLNEGIRQFMTKYNFEDLGAVLVTSSVYRLAESNLMLNFFYLILSIFSGISLFKIGRYLMPSTYAYISVLAFSTSSYFLWYNSSGLKECFMIFLIIHVFLHYYHFIFTRHTKHLLYLFLFLLSLLFFRPAVVFLFTGAIIISYLFNNKNKWAQTFIVILLVLFLFIGSALLESVVNRFLGRGVSDMIESKEASGMVKGGLLFTYMVNVTAGLFGPLPTVLPNVKTMLSFFAPGLIYKIFISIPFWLGVFYALRHKLKLLYPVIFFILLETFSLVFILEGLELRKSIIHFPFIYIIAFKYLSLIPGSHFLDYKFKRFTVTALNLSFFILFTVIIFWNYR